MPGGIITRTTIRYPRPAPVTARRFASGIGLRRAVRALRFSGLLRVESGSSGGVLGAVTGEHVGERGAG
jgi:hypothetical protein